jgi:hypothetical protein
VRHPRRDDDDHADAAVEHAVHLGVGDVASAPEPIEDRRLGPVPGIDARGDVVGKHPMHVLQQAAARDVRHALDIDTLHRRQHRLHVNPRGLEQRCAERARTHIARQRRAQFGTGYLEYLSDQRKAVRVRPARRKPEENVARGDLRTVDGFDFSTTPTAKPARSYSPG